MAEEVVNVMGTDQSIVSLVAWGVGGGGGGGGAQSPRSCSHS